MVPGCGGLPEECIGSISHLFASEQLCRFAGRWRASAAILWERGFGVGGAFLCILYLNMPYNMMVLVVPARKWVESRGWKTEPTESFWIYAALKKKHARGDHVGRRQLDK